MTPFLRTNLSFYAYKGTAIVAQHNHTRARLDALNARASGLAADIRKALKDGA
jgi:hypothetical protein